MPRRSSRTSAADPINHVNKRIHAINATSCVARLLKVPEGSALLQVDHSVYLLRSVLVQYTEEITLDNGITITSVR